MEWSPELYLKLTIRHRLEIDTKLYPGGHILSPKNARKDHLLAVVKGWDSKDIRWVVLSDDEVNLRKQELIILQAKKSPLEPTKVIPALVVDPGMTEVSRDDEWVPCYLSINKEDPLTSQISESRQIVTPLVLGKTRCERNLEYSRA
jgi:hypothetical protein